MQWLEMSRCHLARLRLQIFHRDYGVGLVSWLKSEEPLRLGPDERRGYYMGLVLTRTGLGERGEFNSKYRSNLKAGTTYTDYHTHAKDTACVKCGEVHRLGSDCG